MYCPQFLSPYSFQNKYHNLNSCYLSWFSHFLPILLNIITCLKYILIVLILNKNAKLKLMFQKNKISVYFDTTLPVFISPLPLYLLFNWMIVIPPHYLLILKHVIHTSASSPFLVSLLHMNCECTGKRTDGNTGVIVALREHLRFI